MDRLGGSCAPVTPFQNAASIRITHLSAESPVKTWGGVAVGGIGGMVLIRKQATI